MRRKEIKRISSPHQAGTRPHGTSRPLRLRLGAQIDGGVAAEVVEMRGEEIARGAAAAVAQHDEEIVVGAELARGGEFAERLVERDAVHIDAAVLARPGAARQSLLVDQAA